MLRGVGLTLAVLLLVACGGRSNEGVPHYPGPLLSPGDFGHDFLARQRVVAIHGKEKGRFDAVLQKKGDELIFLALTPFGSRGFLIRQRGDDIRLHKYVPRRLPFPPRYILLDVHRAFLLGFRGAPRPDGAHLHEAGDELVRERWEGGKLHERRYERRSGEPRGEITIRYEGGMVPHGAFPNRVVLDNGWFGYRLEITTSEYRRLP